MSVKRFVAADMRRALELVRVEMGADAVILSSKRVKGGVEILTSNDAYYQSVATPPVQRATATNTAQPNMDADEYYDVDLPMSSDVAWGQESIMSRMMNAAGDGSDVDAAAREAGLASRIDSFQQTLREQTSRQQTAASQQPRARSAQSQSLQQSLNSESLKSQSSHSRSRAALRDDDVNLSDDALQQARQVNARIRDNKQAHAELLSLQKEQQKERQQEQQLTQAQVKKPTRATAPTQPAVKYAQAANPIVVKREAHPIAQKVQPVASRPQAHDLSSNDDSFWVTQAEYYDVESMVDSVANRYPLESFSAEPSTAEATNLQTQPLEESAKQSTQEVAAEKVPAPVLEKTLAASIASLSLGSFQYEPGAANISFQLDPSTYVTPAANQADDDPNGGFLDDLFDEQFSELKTEILDMRELLQTQLSALAKKSQAEAEESKARIVGNTVKTTIKRRLHQLGLPDGEIDKCLATFQPTKNLSGAWAECIARLSHRLPVTGKDVVDNGGFFAFVGPSGAGKTATVAKLASRYVLKHGPKRVALVTTETQNIGGNHQLQRLASILNIELHQVSERNTLEFILQDLSGHKLVLIDTAGARQDDAGLRAQLSRLRRLPQVRSYLVLSANTQIQTLKAAVTSYKAANLSGCVLTKLDETASLGEVLAVVIKANLPIAYTAHGQAMPQDIQIARAHHLVTKAVALLKAGSQQLVKRKQQIRSKSGQINQNVEYRTAEAH